MDEYVLEHLADHLHAASRYYDLHQLITRDWMEKKRARLGSHQSLAHDLDLAIHSDQPTRAAELPRLLKHCLLSMTLNALTSNVPSEVLQAMATAGEVGQALAHADLITDPFRQARAFLSIAAVLVDKEKIDIAEPLWSQAQVLLDDIEQTEERAAVLAALARQMARARRPAKARQLVREAQELVDRMPEAAGFPPRFSEVEVSALTDLGVAQASLGDHESACQTLSQAFSRLERGYESYHAQDWMEALRNVVAALADARDKGGLRRVKAALSRRGLAPTFTLGTWDGLHLYNRSPLAQAVVAQALAQAGEIGQAREALTAAREAASFRFLDQPSYYAAEAMAEIALATAVLSLATAGSRPVQPKPSRQSDDWLRTFNQYVFSPTQVTHRALSEAERTLERLAQEEERARAMSSPGSRLMTGAEGLARLASKARVPGALLAAEHLRDEASSEEEYQRIQHMDNQLTRAVCLAKIATGRALIGEPDRAESLLTQALAVSEPLEDEQRQEMALRQIALAMCRAGGARGLASDVAQAAERFRFEPRRADLHASLAIALAETGRPEAASQAVADALVAARSTSAEDFAMALAPKLVPVGHREGLRLLVADVEKETDRDERATAYAMLAGSLARVGEHDLAQQLVRYVEGTLLSLEGAPEIPLRLALIADAQAELGQHRRCRRSIRRALKAIEALTGQGLVGGLLQRALGDGEEVDEDAEAVWQLAALFLARPVVHVGDDETFARLLEAVQAIKHVEERIEVLLGVVVYVSKEGGEAVLPSGQSDALLDELALLIPTPGQLEPTPAMGQMAQRALREAVAASETLAQEQRADALVSLGLAQGALGDRIGLGQTAAIIAGMPPGLPRSAALGRIAPALARIGDRQGVNRACACVEALDDPQAQIEPLASVVKALGILITDAARAGNAAHVSRLANRMIRLIRQALPSGELVGVTAQAVVLLMKAGMQEAAQRLLSAAEQRTHGLEGTQPGVLGMVARVHALAGDEATACCLLTEGAIRARVMPTESTFSFGGREAAFDYLESAIPALVALDSTGGVLEKVWEGIHEIDHWWLTSRAAPITPQNA